MQCDDGWMMDEGMRGDIPDLYSLSFQGAACRPLPKTQRPTAFLPQRGPLLPCVIATAEGEEWADARSQDRCMGAMLDVQARQQRLLTLVNCGGWGWLHS